MLPWNERFATGLPAIDSQHRMLINNINHLEGMLTSTNPNREECEFLVHLVQFLENYAETHFRVEEQCMERYRCPAHQKNREAHEQFRHFFHQFKQRCQTEGFRVDLLKSLHTAISQWIQNHILEVDIQLRHCARE